MTLRVYNQLVAINHILFDLDGTLADTAPDLVAALNFVWLGMANPQSRLRMPAAGPGQVALDLLNRVFLSRLHQKNFIPLENNCLIIMITISVKVAVFFRE
jgi:FMN phosphatase YigB (HAD superfamily)